MSASAPAASLNRLAATRPALSANTPSDRACRYCCSAVRAEATKCAACGEWLVRTSTGMAAALLRLLASVWLSASAVGAAALWYAGSAARMWLVARAVDPVVTPVVLDLVLYGVVGFVLLQGLTVAVGLTVFAGLTPRRPRWWT
jgi:hypothetical protein